MSLDAYKIAVRISLVENVTRGLSMMSRHFKATDADAKALEARLRTIGKMTLVGGALVGAGAFGLSLLKGPLDEAKAYETELARFASLGFGTKINAQADSYAQGMRTIGTSTRENMALVGDAMAVFKNLDHAKTAAPVIAQMKFANAILFGEAGGARDSKLMDMLKVIEFRGGLSSNAEFRRQADFAQKAISGSRGRVDASAMLQALKTGGVALSRRGNEQFYLGGEPLIQEFGGFRYGTAAMSIYQNLVQSRGTITAQQELFRLGLLDPSKVQFNNLGQLKKALPGSFRGSGILESEGELALLQRVLLPAFAAKGITSPEAITREFGMILGNRTGSALMARIFQQQPILEKQIAANRHAFGVGQSARAAANTPAGQEMALEKREADLKLHIGRMILPMYVKGLELLNSALTKLNAFVVAHPILTKIAVYGFALASAMAVLVGGVILLTAAFLAVPAVAVAIGAAVGATFIGIGVAATLLYSKWDAIKGLLYGVWATVINGFILFANRLIGIANTLSLGLLKIPQIAPIGAPPVPQGVAPTRHAYSVIKGDFYMDGKKVGNITAPYVAANMAKKGSAPNAGTTRFDFSRAPARVATGP